jgi:hypothetical protein
MRFTWIDPLDESKVMGDVKRCSQGLGVKLACTPRYWFLTKDGPSWGYLWQASMKILPIIFIVGLSV